MSDGKSVSFMCISGLNFPERNRKYLMNLAKEAAERHKVKFVVIAGHVFSGKTLEMELKSRSKTAVQIVQRENKQLPAEDRMKIDDVKTAETKSFIEEMVGSFNEFLPEIKGVNYHIVVAEKIYDRPIGREILEKLSAMREDVRVFDDPETKVPVNMPGFGDMRVIVPRKQPWFYDNVTGLMQRLINSFSTRTFSPAPSLIMVGCTGTGAYIPEYRSNVPCIAIPTLHKLDEQISTENMVGCVVVTITLREDHKFDIVPTWYDFRTAVFSERSYGLPEGLSYRHRAIFETLQPSSASLKTVHFRLKQEVKKLWSIEKTEEYLNQLRSNRLVTFNKEQNRYAISESLVRQANLSLDEFLKDSKTITTVDKSCWHVGSLKTLYFTILRDEPKVAEDADAIISNGDVTQGISHNYEYNGELLPNMNGPDKHEILAGLIQAKILADIFSRRWRKNEGEKLTTDERIDRSLITFIYKYGNHDEPRFSHSKNSIPLCVFDMVLRQRLTGHIAEILAKHEIKGVMPGAIEAAVDKKIVRVGESRVAKVNGVPVGVKHPYQSRTQSKGLRIQQTGSFFVESPSKWPDKSFRNISVIKVANFHEAATIFMSSFGRTIFGVMTGAQVLDTLFESNQNKVVNTGIARSTVTLNKDGLVLAASVQYFSDIADEDKKIVFADKLTLQDISELSMKLADKFNMPWR